MTLSYIIQNLQKHFRKRNNLYIVFFTAAIISGCGEKPETKKYVARVNDSFLTLNDLEEKSDTSYKNNFYRNEIIRNWIDEELLYQAALNEGIIEEEEFNRIINSSERILAGALLLKKVSDQYEVVYSENDLEEFYNLNAEEFKLKEKAFLLNIAEFTDEDKAIEFRTSVLQEDWRKAAERETKENVFSEKENLMVSISDIYPSSVRNILQELYPNELSIIINTDTSMYKIFQVLQIYPGGTIPPFDLIKENVEKRFIFSEKRKFVNDYIRKLYSENDIEVKNQDYK